MDRVKQERIASIKNDIDKAAKSMSPFDMIGYLEQKEKTKSVMECEELLEYIQSARRTAAEKKSRD